MSEMLELGTLLREERERKGLTVEELSERIKLAPRTLAFIESGTKSELPHAVYVKGFVKSYATVVGLNPEELGAMVDDAYKEELEEELAEQVVPERKRNGFPVKAAAAVVLVCLLAAAGYMYMTTNAPVKTQDVAAVADDVEPTAPAVEDATAPAIPASENAAVPAEEPAVDVAEPVAEEPVAPVVEKTQAAAPVVEAKEEPVAAPPVVAPMDVAETQDDVDAVTSTPVAAVEHALRIQASADCWVEAKGDGFGRKEFLLRSGESYTVTFPKELSVRLGNSGGITLTLDGKPYAFDGKDGKVRTVQITAS